MDSAKNFKVDTSAVENDEFTVRIKELIKIGGVFSAQEAIDFKIQEAREKKETPEKVINEFENYIKEDKGKQYLENALVHIYREHFTLKEINEFIMFYNSSAGKKLKKEFPSILLKSLKATEEITTYFVPEN